MSRTAIRRDLGFIGCIVLLSLWGLQTFFRPGLFETHDGRLHVIRLFWFDEELRSGQFPVRWSETANHRYGYPVFNFYYPFFYLVAESVHLIGFSLVDALKIVAAGSFLLSGIAAYFWLKTFAGRWPALAGSVVFLLAPYRLELLFVMGRWAESFAFLPLMLVLWMIGKFGKTKDRKYLFLGGLFLAFLILSHNAVALLLLPVILIYNFYIGYKDYKTMIIAIILGLGLSAWFWIPALAEARYTLQGQRSVYDFRQNFPSLRSYLYYPWGYGFSLTGEPNGVSPMIGLGQLAGVGVGLAALIFLKFSHSHILKNLRMILSSSSSKSSEKILIFGLGGAVLIFFMMNSVSVPVWEKLPLLQAVQFPGRLNAVLLAMIALTAAAGLQTLAGNRKIQAGLAIFLIGFTVYANRNYLRAGVPDRFFDQDVTGAYWFRFGTGDSSHESTPVWSRPLPAEWTEKIEADSGNIEISQIELSPRKYKFTADVKEGEGEIKVNTIYYPGWRARVDDEELKLKIPIEENNPYGLIKFAVSKGNHQIAVFFTETPMRLVADLISFISFLALVKAWPFLKRPGLS